MENLSTIIDVLYECPIFENLDKKTIKGILQQTDCCIKNYKKNEIICITSSPSYNIGIVITGCIEVQKNLSSGNIICIDQKKRGQPFGGAVIFSDKLVYTYDLFSKTKSEILFINRESIQTFMSKNSIIAINLLNTLSKHMMYYEKKIEMLAYSSIKKKIAFYLLYDADYKQKSVITLPFSKKTWSEYLNVSRPSLYRELNELRTNQILDFHKNKITILKPNILQNML